MIFAAINWLSISINLLLVVFVIVCLLMALLILMQRPKQEGLGAAFGGGVTDQVFGARTTNVLQKGTVYLGSLFFVLSMVLSILIAKQTKAKSLLDDSKPVAAETAKESEQIPVTPEPIKSLAEELAPTDTTAPNEGSTEGATEQTPAPVEETPAAQPDAPAEEAPAPPAVEQEADKTE